MNRRLQCRRNGEGKENGGQRRPPHWNPCRGGLVTGTSCVEGTDKGFSGAGPCARDSSSQPVILTRCSRWPQCILLRKACMAAACRGDREVAGGRRGGSSAGAGPGHRGQAWMRHGGRRRRRPYTDGRTSVRPYAGATHPAPCTLHRIQTPETLPPPRRLTGDVNEVFDANQ